MHVVDGSSPDPCGDYAAIRQELSLFSPGLAGKRQLVAYNKMDLPDSADYADIVRDFLIQQVGSRCALAISGTPLCQGPVHSLNSSPGFVTCAEKLHQHPAAGLC